MTKLGGQRGDTEMKTTRGLILTTLCLGMILSASPLWAMDPPPNPSSTGVEPEHQSLTEVNKKMANPTSNLWYLNFQQNNYRLDMGEDRGDRWNSNLNFQPVMPIALTEDYNLVTRPVIPLFISQPHPDPGNPAEIDRTTGFGDTTLMFNIAGRPHLTGNWLLGLGPTFVFPTASTDETGQGKWQVGPAAIVGYISKNWILAGFVQQWWSFAGSDRRASTNWMNLQPIATYFLHDGWSIGYSGNILANWEVNGDDRWTVPIGLGVSKVAKFGKLPVKITLAGQYMPVHPDELGQKWNIQLTFAPVIPQLFKGNLFGD
jgi:hypothetical protein